MNPLTGKRLNVKIARFFLALLFVFPSPGFSQTAPVSDEDFLELIQRKSFDYFIHERNSANGLVRDRAHNFKPGATPSPASIAAVGFALTAYPVGVSRNWIDFKTAREMTLTTLRFFLEKAPHERGFFYHFMNMETGARIKNSELSPIDTALFLAGALFAAEYFEDPEIRRLAQKIYQRIDWKWMLNGGKTFALSWSPETGFQRQRWDHYNESMILYLLAMGAPSKKAIPASSWKAITRPAGSYGGYRVLKMAPLFTHQYSHIWMDFRHKNDGFADYFRNSIDATLANRAFCIDQSKRYKSYGPNSWGLTASDGPGGYKAYGALPGHAVHDGTIAPTGCGSSIVFTPEESIDCLRFIYENIEGVWGRYGFADAYNVDRQWIASDVIGIDQGALLLMIENYRTQMVWKIMSKNTSLQKAMEAAGFKDGDMELPWPDPPAHKASFLPEGLDLDGSLRDWPSGTPIYLGESQKEVGDIRNKADLEAQIRFGWNHEALFFYAKVTDESLVARKTSRNIWMDDLIEIYIDAEGDGLFWGNPKDFQIGFRPDADSGSVSTWSWFGEQKDPQSESMIYARHFADASGFVVEAAIRWEFLGLKPEADHFIHLSVAVHDADQDRSAAKIQWFFRNEDVEKKFVLGKVLLEK